MLGRIIAALIALALALPVGSQNLSDGSAQSSPLPWWQTGRHASSLSDSSSLSPAAARAYSQMPQNSCVGVGVSGRFTASNTLVITEDDEAKNSFDAVSFCGGGYFSLPLSSWWSAWAKLLGGYVRYPKLSLAGKTVPSAGGFTFGTGMSLSFKVNSSYGMRLFLDYNLLPPHSKSSNEYMNMLTLGTSFVVLL